MGADKLKQADMWEQVEGQQTQTAQGERLGECDKLHHAGWQQAASSQALRRSRAGKGGRRRRAFFGAHLQAAHLSRRKGIRVVGPQVHAQHARLQDGQVVRVRAHNDLAGSGDTG